jgi:hypothetical protein
LFEVIKLSGNVVESIRELNELILSHLDVHSDVAFPHIAFYSVHFILIIESLVDQSFYLLVIFLKIIAEHFQMFWGTVLCGLLLHRIYIRSLLEKALIGVRNVILGALKVHNPFVNMCYFLKIVGCLVGLRPNFHLG